MDHNALQGTLGQLYNTRIVGTVDHHTDEGIVPQDVTDEPRIIETAGSCSSLIVNHFQQQWDAWFLYVSFSGAANGQGDNLIEDGAFATLWDAQVAQLALAAILADTTDLEDEHKTTQHDRDAVTYLEAKIKMSPRVGKEYKHDEFFKLVSDAKHNLDGLSIRDILRKDYKQWTEHGLVLGTSAVVQPIGYMERKVQGEGNGDLVTQTMAFATEMDLNVMAILTTFEVDGGQFHRELLVMSRDDRGKQMVERFIEQSSQTLKLDEVDRRDEDGCYSISWKQGNLAASRKQVAPLLRKAMML